LIETLKANFITKSRFAIDPAMTLGRRSFDRRVLLHNLSTTTKPNRIDPLIDTWRPHDHMILDTTGTLPSFSVAWVFDMSFTFGVISLKFTFPAPFFVALSHLKSCFARFISTAVLKTRVAAIMPLFH
jgi:hypothetical protein